MVRLIGLFVVGSLLLIGCGEDKQIDTRIEEGAFTGTFSVHVSDGNPVSRPVYTWSNGANTDAMRVTVARVADVATAVWEVQSDNPSLDNIQSPVTHGVSQPSTFESATDERDLQTDIWYRVTVTKSDFSTASRDFLIKP